MPRGRRPLARGLNKRGGGTGGLPPRTGILALDAGGSEGGAGFGGGVFSMLTKLLAQYSLLLDKQPYLTRIISSGIVGGSGDVLIQLLQRRDDPTIKFDWRRLSVFTTVAALYIAPVIYLWFGYLNKLPFPAGMSQLSKAGIMTLLDQTFGAVVISAGFFYFFEMVQHLVPPYPKERTVNFIQAGHESNVRNLWDTLVVNWYCWPLINFVNFMFIPAQFRVLFSNFAAVGWNCYLSKKANS